MSINLQSTVYVEGYCEACKRKTFFWTKMIDLEIEKSIGCAICKKGKIAIVKYESVR
jgi:hypothetical protein